jgi:hypothetical protein
VTRRSDEAPRAAERSITTAAVSSFQWGKFGLFGLENAQEREHVAAENDTRGEQKGLPFEVEPCQGKNGSCVNVPKRWGGGFSVDIIHVDGCSNGQSAHHLRQQKSQGMATDLFQRL